MEYFLTLELNLDITFIRIFHTVGLLDCFEGRETVECLRFQLYTLKRFVP